MSKPVTSQPDAVGFEQGSAAAHERISDLAAGKIVAGEVKVGKRRFAELGERERPEQAARPPSEPFVYGDNGPVVLLNLLFALRQRGNEGYIKVRLDGHRRPPPASLLVSRQASQSGTSRWSALPRALFILGLPS